MIFNRRKTARSRKGFTLIEFVIAFTVTAILAATLSAMIRPVLGAYSTNKTRETLRVVSGRVFTAIRKELCDATDIRLATNVNSFPSKDNGKGYSAIARCDSTSDKSKDYYSRLRCVAKWDSNNKPVSTSLVDANLYENAVVYTAESNAYSFYLIPVKNAANSNKLTALKVGLVISIGSVEYKEERVIECENLIVSGKEIYTADCTKTTPDKVTAGKVYYSVWYKGLSAA